MFPGTLTTEFVCPSERNEIINCNGERDSEIAECRQLLSKPETEPQHKTNVPNLFKLLNNEI